ncbi:MAG TPA: Sec-independent protein translocase protein TatB [Dehalococcoidia bacterium]|jgi:sec-independent protein translocase protein TatB|nr:Sec-independent protein translocase protein TatB [Dehalococcoidia bacterium]
MNFFGVGAFELALVAIIAVIVLGPERIPGVAVQLARAVRYMRGYATDATADIRKELEELTKEYDEVRKEFQEFRTTVRKDVSSVAEEVSKAVRQGGESAARGPITEPGGDPPPKRSRSEKDNGRG